MKLNNHFKRLILWFPLAASAGTFLMKMGANSHQKNNSKNMISVPNFKGTWLTGDRSQHLVVQEFCQLIWNDSLLEVALQHTSPDKVVLRDRYGYSLTLKKIDADTLSLFDEADDQEYIFQKYKEALPV